MPRAIWTGVISFGLVTIPVKLYPAVQRKSVRFHQLHGRTGARIQQRRVDPGTGEEVAFEDVVKGYELSPDRYVVLEPGELQALEPARTKAIEIEDFVREAEIDPMLYDHQYYLVPATGGAKPYRLLLEAMHRSGRVAIARVVLRSKEQLVAIRPARDVLQMSTLVFADEVIDPAGLDELPDPAAVPTSARELEVAVQLVESLATDWDPGRYRDEHRRQVLALIERKAAGEPIAAPVTPEPQAAPVPDLMSALTASLQAVRAREPEASPAARSGGGPRDGRRPQAPQQPSADSRAPSAGVQPRG